MVRGDFNIRTGREGGNGAGGTGMESETIEGQKDEQGEEGKGWSIFNENIRGDESGKFTFTGGKGNTVTDYVMGSVEIRERITEMSGG